MSFILRVISDVLKEFDSTNLQSIDNLELSYQDREELKSRGISTIGEAKGESRKSLIWLNISCDTIKNLDKALNKKGYTLRN